MLVVSKGRSIHQYFKCRKVTTSKYLFSGGGDPSWTFRVKIGSEKLREMKLQTDNKAGKWRMD